MTATVLATMDRLLGDLASSARKSEVDYLATAHATLVHILARPDLLEVGRLQRVPGALSRNLLWGTEEISVWAMVWGAGAKTSVHDHHCSCCFGMLSGSLRETWFRAISDTHAIATAETVRTPGFVACMMPTGPNLHRMVNDGPEPAISIHVYGYDHKVMSSSIERTYDVAAA